MGVILEHRQWLRALLYAKKFDQLLDVLPQIISENSDLYKTLIKTYSRYQCLVPHKICETMPTDIIKLEENRICTSLLEIINQLKQSDIRGDLQIEISLVRKEN